MAVSNIGFAAVTIILLIVAVAGFGLYAVKPTASPSTAYSTTTVYSTTTASSTILNAVKQNESGGFYNAQDVTFFYKFNFNCTPSLLSFYSNETSAAAQTNCEVGQGNATAVSAPAALWILVPAYAGLSIFGVTSLNATADGFPTFEGNTIVTQCGAGGTTAACVDHPTLLYSPFFTAVEQHIGITSGFGGLPEGVLPTPAHDHLIDCCLQTVPWYTITVLVFDPNIMPNAVTGQCTEVVPSNLTNPTANCLSSYSNLANALTTHSNATISANGRNPIWQTLGNPASQVVVPGATVVTELSNMNTNLFEYFTVNSTNPYFSNNLGG